MTEIPAALRDLTGPPRDAGGLRHTARRGGRRVLLRVATGAAAAAVLAAVGACAPAADRAGGGVPRDAPTTAGPASTAPSTVVPSPQATAPSIVVPSPQATTPSTVAPSLGTRRVDVYFSTGTGICDEVRAYAREVPSSAPLRPALEEPFAGPTAAERAPGAGPSPTVGLRSVRVVEDRVHVDLDADRFPGTYTASCGGVLFNAQLRATVDGIVPGAEVVVALDGDPERFVQAQQGFCPEPARLGDRCDASGF